MSTRNASGGKPFSRKRLGEKATRGLLQRSPLSQLASNAKQNGRPLVIADSFSYARGTAARRPPDRKQKSDLLPRPAYKKAVRS